MNTNADVMAWIMDEYSRHHGFSPGVVTGKPLHLFGSEGREEATGRGVMYALEEALGDQGARLWDVTVALQGFGNVGSHAGAADRRARREDRRRGGSQGAACPTRPASTCRRSWPTAATEHRTVAGFAAATPSTGIRDHHLARDVLIPAALEDAITDGRTRPT